MSFIASNISRSVTSTCARGIMIRPPIPSGSRLPPSFMSHRPFTSTTSVLQSSLLDAFRDPVPRQQRGTEPVGRPWSARELRRKSYEDLHKLWYVLYKERNVLLTEQQLSRRKGLIFPQPERISKVRKSMGAIKQVLGERKRSWLSKRGQMGRMEAEMIQEAEDDDGMDEIESKEKN